MASAHQAPSLLLLDRLATHLDAHKSEKFSEKDRKARGKKFVKILEDVCTVVRDAERKASPQFAEVVEKAHGMLNDALRYAYSQAGGFSYIATFAHSEDEPFVEDALEHAGAYIQLLGYLYPLSKHLGSDILDAFLKVYATLVKPGAREYRFSSSRLYWRKGWRDGAPLQRTLHVLFDLSCQVLNATELLCTHADLPAYQQHQGYQRLRASAHGRNHRGLTHSQHGCRDFEADSPPPRCQICL